MGGIWVHRQMRLAICCVSFHFVLHEVTREMDVEMENIGRCEKKPGKGVSL